MEYIDGDHEWIDVDEAADRLQLYDASGSWSDFNVAVRPALAERQNKRAEKADIKVRVRSTGGETRAWTVLPEKESDDEYDDDDDEAALERRWRWPRSGNAKVDELPHGGDSLPVARCCLLDGVAGRGQELLCERGVLSVEHGETGSPTQVSSTGRPGKEFTTIPASPRIRTCRMCGRWKLECLNALRPALTLVQVSWKRGIRPRKARAARRRAKRRSNACSRTPRRLSGTCHRRFCGPRSSGQRKTSLPTRN